MDQQLVVFVTVAEEKNFTRAAERLHISQPGISQHIANLEQQLQVKLLDRNNKYVRLNRAGEVVYHHAKEILRIYDEMHRLLDDLKGSAHGPLLIGASFTFGEYVLPHLIAEFYDRYPKITPTIVIENTQMVITKVASGELDIGVIEGATIHDATVEVEPLADDNVVVVASTQHRLANRSVVTANDMSDEHWIVREHGSGTREVTDYLFREYHIQPKSMVEYDSMQVIKESVEAGLGITLLSRWAVRRELKWQTLRELEFAGSPLHRQFSIAVRKSDFMTKTTVLFREFLREQSPRISTLDLGGISV